MRSIRFRSYALLLALALSAPLYAQVPPGNAPTQRARPGNGTTVVVGPQHLQALQARLDSFAVALPAEERALWNDVLLRATYAPASAAAEVRVTPVLEIGPGGGCEDSPGMGEAANRVAIIVQGGRTAGAGAIVVQGGRTPRAGIVVQGGRTPRAQGAEVPRPNPNATVAIGPKPEDPASPPQSLGRRLAQLAAQSSAEERAALNWLLTRAAEGAEARPGAAGGRPGTSGGLPPGAQGMDGFWWPPISRALGIDPRAIGPKPEDPGRGRTEQRWILRY